jgi:hypothetical protein
MAARRSRTEVGVTRPLLAAIILIQLELLLLIIAFIVLAARVDAAPRSAAQAIPATSRPLAAGTSESDFWAVDRGSAFRTSAVGGPDPQPSPSASPAVVLAQRHSPETKPVLRPSMRGISGWATWYRWHPGEAAAGPGLRAFLGANWRYQSVTVCAGVCVRVRLTDWCACPGGRVVDLDSRSFARLAPLSQGIVSVSVTR